MATARGSALRLWRGRPVHACVAGRAASSCMLCCIAACTFAVPPLCRCADLPLVPVSIHVCLSPAPRLSTAMALCRSAAAQAVMLVLMLLATTAHGAVLRGSGVAASELPTFPNIKYVSCRLAPGSPIQLAAGRGCGRGEGGGRGHIAPLHAAMPCAPLHFAGRHVALLHRARTRRYLGLGYNVVTGNPFTNGADPGFAPEARQQMLKLTYNDGRQYVCHIRFRVAFAVLGPRTRSGLMLATPPLCAHRYDNQYAVPDGMNVIDDASCSYSTSTHTSTSASDYQKALQTQMSFSASADDWFGSFEFSASAGYQSFTSNNEKAGDVQVSATAHCTAYGADVDGFGWKPTFTDEFHSAVYALGESLQYDDFIKLFGTHYVTGMQMGGSSTYAATMKRSSLAEMNRTGVDISAAASLSFFAKVGASVSHSSKASDYKTFSSAVTSDTLSGIPEPAPQCGGKMCSDYSAWSAAVTANPQPLNIKLASITTLLTPRYFPKDGNITTKAAALASFLANDYCGTVPACASAPPPPPVLRAHLALSVELDSGRSFYGNMPDNCDGVTVASSSGSVTAGGLVRGRCLFNATWAPQQTLVLYGGCLFAAGLTGVRSCAMIVTLASGSLFCLYVCVCVCGGRIRMFHGRMARS